MDYVVSGPVWEYYSGYNWENGLIQELKMINSAALPEKQSFIQIRFLS